MMIFHSDVKNRFTMGLGGLYLAPSGQQPARRRAGMTEIRANYYRVRGRSELDLQHIGADGRPIKVETLIVASKSDARKVARDRGAIEWNF